MSEPGDNCAALVSPGCFGNLCSCCTYDYTLLQDELEAVRDERDHYKKALERIAASDIACMCIGAEVAREALEKKP